MSTIIGLVVAVVGTLIALGAWLRPDAGRDAAAERTAATSPGTGPSAIPVPGSPPALSAVALNTVQPLRGRNYYRELPEDLGVAHPVVLECPTNQTGDKVREVTYPLDGRYESFSAVLRAHYEPAADWRVSALPLAGTLRRDGHLAWAEAEPAGTDMRGTATVRADLDGAKELTVRVGCERPGGLVILADAVLRRAG